VGADFRLERFGTQGAARKTTKRVMNPWEIWLWPWIVASALVRRALETIHQSVETNDGNAVLPLSELGWASPNHVTIDLDAMRVRDFSDAQSAQRPALIVAPFALHDARIADLASGHSLIEALRANDCCRLFLIEWKSATAKTKLRTIDSYLSDLNVAVDDIGPPVDLIGLCQGGWLSLIYAARFPGKVRRLVLAGAPIDVMAEPSLPSARAGMTPNAVIDDIIRAGNGLVLGRTLLDLWPQEDDESAFVIDALQFPGPPVNEKDRKTVEAFLRWQRRPLDLPGPYFSEVCEWVFRENRIAAGRFCALGRVVELRELHCPLFLLAGDRDSIATPGQVLAAAALTGAHARDVETAIAPCGHLALFVGQDTLKNIWPRIAHWLSDRAIHARKSRSATRGSPSVGLPH
jgi:poly(3-hydroxyalkanoate) synthetase